MTAAADLHHLSAAFVLDALTADERAAFEAHEARCETCRREVAEFRETVALLAVAGAVTPPPNLGRRVSAGIAGTQQVEVPEPSPVVGLAARRHATKSRTQTRNRLLVGAAAVLFAVAGTLAVWQSPNPVTEAGELLAAPDSLVAELDGETGTLQVAWSSDGSRLAIVGNNLADPGPDRTYELWFLLQSGEVVSAGLFGPDSSGDVAEVVAVGDRLEVSGFGVTVEPAGGSPQPTSDVVFVGSL